MRLSVPGDLASGANFYREQTLALVESKRRLGRKIVTECMDGFVVEGGPDAFLSYKPRGLGLCRELGLEGRWHGTNEDDTRDGFSHVCSMT